MSGSTQPPAGGSVCVRSQAPPPRLLSCDLFASLAGASDRSLPSATDSPSPTHAASINTKKARRNEGRAAERTEAEGNESGNGASAGTSPRVRPISEVHVEVKPKLAWMVPELVGSHWVLLMVASHAGARSSTGLSPRVCPLGRAPVRSSGGLPECSQAAADAGALRWVPTGYSVLVGGK